MSHLVSVATELSHCTVKANRDNEKENDLGFVPATLYGLWNLISFEFTCPKILLIFWFFPPQPFNKCENHCYLVGPYENRHWIRWSLSTAVCGPRLWSKGFMARKCHICLGNNELSSLTFIEGSCKWVISVDVCHLVEDKNEDVESGKTWMPG